MQWHAADRANCEIRCYLCKGTMLAGVMLSQPRPDGLAS